MIISHKIMTAPGVQETGGKGHNLLLLKQAGFRVPPFAIIRPVFFEERDETKLPVAIESLLPQLLQDLSPGPLYAVRSSATAEDRNNFSFAGQFKTLLNVTANDLPRAITEVWASARQIAAGYLQHAGETDVKMAVVVQEMVDATTAGVAFGINPLTGNTDEIVINAIHGLGEDLVSGRKNADSYTVSEAGIQKKTAHEYIVLTDEQINTVATNLRRLNSIFGQPQDIEFAFKGNDFYLLQSRPVTARPKHQNGEKTVWDNSNIIESYPGMTLPLTFSFIEKMYAAVYKQLSMVLGINSAKVKKYADVYDNMLGLLNGRVYYNLNSWYAALSLLPGYKLNAGFMEKMMGVKEKADVKLLTEEDIKGKGLKAYWELVVATISIIKNLRSVRKQRDEFIQDFNSIYNIYAYKDYSQSTVKDIYTDYLAFENMMVTKWKAPLVNDFFAMIYFGVLQKLCAKYFPNHPDIHNQLVAASKDIITTEPIIRLPKLAALLIADATLARAMRSEPAEEVWHMLNSRKYPAQLKEVQQYLDDWGERTVAELKLETITYTQEPERLIAVLQTYIRQGTTYIPANNTEEHRVEAERVAEEELRGKLLKRKIFNHVLKQARYLVSNRENLRYYRTKGFGVVRRMMYAIGKRMEEQHMLFDARDVFYLSLTDVEDVANGILDELATKQLVRAKKADYALYEKLPLPERVETYGRPEKVVVAPATVKTTGAQLNELQGIPCCAGVVQAKVCKVSSVDGRFPDDEILVTYATDPGYVVMFPSSKGILTERGSLLSHAAIVSREMNIPCIVGLDGLMQQLNDGDEIIMDGSTGVVKILARKKK